jgi:hypothetical protein
MPVGENHPLVRAPVMRERSLVGRPIECLSIGIKNLEMVYSDDLAIGASPDHLLVTRDLE